MSIKLIEWSKMEPNQRIKEEVEKSLSSIDNLAQAEAPDFFYTRLEARMEKELRPNAFQISWLANSRVSMAVLGLFMVLNVGTIFLITQSESQSNSAEADIDTFKQEYFSASDDYEYLNNY